jgi:hypothetical protein
MQHGSKYLWVKDSVNDEEEDEMEVGTYLVSFFPTNLSILIRFRLRH